MSMSPSTLLAKLDELKKWQQIQQERLLQQHNSRLQEVTTEMQNVQNPTVINKQKQVVQNDNLVIGQNDMKPNTIPEVPTRVVKPKQPFLKKGSGLQKYGMRFGDQKHPVRKMNAVQPKENRRVEQLKVEESINKPERKESDKFNEPNPCKASNEKINKLEPLKAPEVAIQPKARWIVSEDNGPETDNETTDDQYVINTGVCLSDALNTPNPYKEEAISAIDDNLLLCLKKLAADKFGDPATPKQQNDSEIINQLQHSLNKLDLNASTPINNAELVKYLRDLVKKYGNNGNITTTTTETESVSKNTIFDDTQLRELHNFELLEQKVMQNSFCSTNSSVLELLSSTPHKTPNNLEPIIEHHHPYIKPKAKKSLDFQESNVSCESSVVSEDLVEKTLDCNSWESDDDETNSDTEELPPPSKKVIVKQNVGVMTDVAESTTSHANEELLATKLHELNKEIENFRIENKKIQQMRLEMENERKQMQIDMRKFQKELNEERATMEFELEEEKKKLAKEKMVFERYSKDLQNKPSRREREEISNLKIELANIKETLKLKETRNGTTQARLRNQIKSLEKENANLKEEVEKLQTQNAKLVASRKVLHRKSPCDTKMLHEISKNLTKLTQESKISKKISCNDIDAEDYDVTSYGDYETKKKALKENDYISEYRRSFSSPNIPVGRQRCYSESSDSTPYEHEKASDLSTGNSRHSLERNSCSVKKSTNKENDKNTSNVDDVSDFKNISDISITNNYEKVFGSKDTRNGSLNDTHSSTSSKAETIFDDGTKETKYTNGNVKVTSADGNFITLKYFNGDIKETRLLDGTIKYYYKETQMWQTTLPDGNEIWEFPDGQVEKHFTDRSTEAYFPNGIVKKTDKDGNETINYPDGSIVNVQISGDKVLYLPNGQKEIHSKDQKRREYPDGTVKIIYADGLQETRYSNGRIRMKDKDGTLLMDSHSDL